MKKVCKFINKDGLFRSPKIKYNYHRRPIIMARDKETRTQSSDDRWQTPDYPAASSGV